MTTSTNVANDDNNDSNHDDNDDDDDDDEGDPYGYPPHEVASLRILGSRKSWAQRWNGFDE